MNDNDLSPIPSYRSTILSQSLIKPHDAANQEYSMSFISEQTDQLLNASSLSTTSKPSVRVRSQRLSAVSLAEIREQNKQYEEEKKERQDLKSPEQTTQIVGFNDETIRKAVQEQRMLMRPGTAQINKQISNALLSSSSQSVKKVNQMVTVAKVQMNVMKRRTFKGSELQLPKHRNDEDQSSISYIMLLPFELIMMISSYCAAEESFAMISLNRDLRSNFIAAKTILYRQQFCNKKQLASELKIQKYFKIMESAGSRDLFVFYELLVWAIRERNSDLFIDQLNSTFPKILIDCLEHRRIMDRFLAFFTPQVIDILTKLFEPLTIESLTQDRIDLFFEYLVNKRRKYDGNTLAQLAIKFESPEILTFLMDNHSRWKVDVKTRNKDGFCAIHMCVKQRSQSMFRLVSKYSQQLVLPVGLVNMHANIANISTYEDTITICAGIKISQQLDTSTTVNEENQLKVLECFSTLFHSVNSITTVHMLNVKKSMLVACQNNHLDIVRFLVNQGFQLNQNTIWKKTPLFIACEYGHLELATYLIGRFEIDINFQCEDSHKSALFIAAEKGYTQIVEELIKRPDVDVNKMTAGKKTALYVAIERGYIECVKQILRRCKLADLYLETSFSTTPLYIAQRKGDREIVRLMLLVGKKPNFNYCNDQDNNEANEFKKGINLPLIINELPRFAADLNDAQETEIRNSHNGTTTLANRISNHLINVTSRYLEPKKVIKAEEESTQQQQQQQKQALADFQQKNPFKTQTNTSSFRLRRPQTANIAKLGFPETTNEEVKEEIKEEAQDIIEESEENKELEEEEKRNEHTQRQQAPTQPQKASKQINFPRPQRRSSALTKTQDRQVEPEPQKPQLVNPDIMSRVKSRLFDYVKKQKEDIENEEEEEVKASSHAPPNINKLIELSKPNPRKQLPPALVKLDPKDCFSKRINPKRIAHVQYDQPKEQLAQSKSMRNLSKQQSNRLPSERLKNPTNPLVSSVNRFFQNKVENTDFSAQITKKTGSSNRQSQQPVQNKKKSRKIIRVNLMKQQPSLENADENRDIEEFMDDQVEDFQPIEVEQSNGSFLEFEGIQNSINKLQKLELLIQELSISRDLPVTDEYMFKNSQITHQHSTNQQPETLDVYDFNEEEGEEDQFQRDFEFRGDQQSEFNHTEPEEFAMEQVTSQIFSLQASPQKFQSVLLSPNISKLPKQVDIEKHTMEFELIQDDVSLIMSTVKKTSGKFNYLQSTAAEVLDTDQLSDFDIDEADIIIVDSF